MEAQGYMIRDNVNLQDIQSTMLLVRNGQQSSGKATRHIDVRYYFIKDQIDQKLMRLEYCPTDIMVTDVLTKPLQGTQFRCLRALLLNYADPALMSVKIKIATQSPGVKTGLSSLATKILTSGLSDRARKPPSSLSVILTLFCVAPE